MTSVTDGMKNLAKHRSLRALILGLVLFAAACGSSEDVISSDAEAPAEDSSDSADSADSGDDAMEDEDDAMEDEEDAMEDDDHSDDDAMEDGAMEDDDDAMEDDAESGEEAAAPSGPPVSLPRDEAKAAAEQNIPNLQSGDDLRDIEVVSVYDGSITSLREVVTGDRPVLLWFWAPH